MDVLELAFLHIPKTGGTSLHRALIRYYGEQALFWFGKDCPADIRSFPRDLRGRPVAGGHKPLRFYPATLDPLYCAVLREPVSRAVSLFAYYTQPELAETPRERQTREEHLARLRRRGMDPDSISRSIRHCRAFRRELSNFQCAYLSRGKLSRFRPDFEGVLQSLAGRDVLVGTVADYSAFHRALGELLGWPPEAPEVSNRSRENYQAAYLRDPELVALVRELNREDEKLLDFVEREHRGLWLQLRDPGRRRQRLRDLPLKPWLRGGADWDWEAAGRRLWPDSRPSRLPWPLWTLLVGREQRLLYPPIPGPTDAWVHRQMLSLCDIPHREAVDDLGMGRVLARFNTGLLLRDYSVDEAKAIIADPRYFKFAVIQEPVRRLEDVYLEWFVGRRLELDRWPQLANLVAAVQGMNGPDLERGISFRQFVGAAVEQPPLKRYVLWLGQHLFLRGVEAYDRLYRPDQMEHLHADLMAHTGRSLPMVQLPGQGTGGCTDPQGGDTGGDSGSDADCLPVELQAQSPRGRPDLVDLDLRARILEYYREDAELYNGIHDNSGKTERL